MSREVRHDHAHLGVQRLEAEGAQTGGGGVLPCTSIRVVTRDTIVRADSSDRQSNRCRNASPALSGHWWHAKEARIAPSDGGPTDTSTSPQSDGL